MNSSKEERNSLTEEMSRNPELTKEDMVQLQEWNRNAPHLPNLSEEMLAIFFHSCYLDIEKTKTAIDIHYTIRTFAPEFFNNLDPLDENIQNAFNVYEMGVLPRTDANGNKMLLVRMHDTNPAHMCVDSSIRLFIMTCLLTLHLDGTCPGFVFLADMDGTTLKHITKLSLSLIRKFTYYMQEAQPLRMNSIHIMNSGMIIDKGFTFVKPFLNPNIVRLIHFHSKGIEEFYKHVPKSLLPQDYGGELGPFKDMNESLKNLLITNRNWLLQEQEMKSDEMKRVGGPKTSGKVFGFGM